MISLNRKSQFENTDLHELAANVKTRNDAIAAYNAAKKTYETDFAAFQAQLTEKGQNWIKVNYPKVPTEVKKFKTLYPPTLPVVSKAAMTPEYSVPDASKGNTFNGIFVEGSGATTAGTIKAEAGTKKSFGVRGQGKGKDQGYMFPVEDSKACTTKYLAVSVYPTNPEYTQGDDTLSLEFTSEAAQKIDFTQTKFATGSVKNQEESEKKVLDKYLTYAQDQELAEFLGASSLVAATASVATLAAMTLF